MFAQTVPIDQGGRITLPQQILEALGVPPEAEVVIALTETGVVQLLDLPVSEVIYCRFATRR